MTSPYPATIINLSSGQILFNDPSESPPWDPESLGALEPVFPSTSLAIGVQGTIPNRNIESIQFTNIFKYEPFEQSTLSSSFQKSLVINQQGIITYEDPKIGLVSTVSLPFESGISSFFPSSLGGANIYDVFSGSPDTFTNALGKLDAWIANAFLKQPPAVTPIKQDSTSLYGGVQWLNPRVYSILDKSVPYVTSILFIIGDPNTNNVVSFQMSNSSFFPYKMYRDGISPYLNPLVRLRIFTDYFPQSADELYTKTVLSTKCIDIITEKGTASIPETGKVFAIDYTDRAQSYTTVSVYLPNLATTYPKDTPVPLQVIYLNQTEGQANIAYAPTITNSSGGPSPLNTIDFVSADVSSFRMRVTQPIFADEPGQVSTPYFSSYSLGYTLERLATAHSQGFGFRYGTSSPSDIPTLYQDLLSTHTQDFQYLLSTQNTLVHPLYPGCLWSTTGYATNLAKINGENTEGPVISTLFPNVTLSTLQSSAIQNISYSQTRYAEDGFLKTLSYTNGSGWTTQSTVTNDVFFLSSPTTFKYQLNTQIQWNDASFPGDRSTITLYTNVGNAVTVSTMQNNVPLDLPFSSVINQNHLTTTIRETATVSSFQNYFYGADVSGEVIVSTLNSDVQTLQLFMSKAQIQGFNSPIEEIIQSTQAYIYQTEPSYPVSTDVLYNNRCLSTTSVSGIVTPSLTSQFQFDIATTNFASRYSAPEFANAYLVQNTTPIGPLASYSTNVYIYDGNTEVTSLPLPSNTVLRLSTCSVGVYSTIYQDPFSPSFFNLYANVQPANPEGIISTSIKSLTSSIFMDTVSLRTYSTFCNSLSPNGIRIQSSLPRNDIGISATDIQDSINLLGAWGNGLNTDVDADIQLSTNVVVSPAIIYQHASSISSFYTNFYDRELLYTNGHFTHPAGYDLSIFNGDSIGRSDAVYPNFSYDKIYDVNNGFRYASFVFESPTLSTPTNLQYLNIRIINPSLVSTISDNYTQNTWFPDIPTTPYLMSCMQVRLHAKLFGSYTDYAYKNVSTAWLDGFQLVNDSIYNDQVYGTPGCVGVSAIGNDVEYKVQINRRAYTKLCSIVRIGLSKDSGVYAGDYPITFDAIQTRYSDN